MQQIKKTPDDLILFPLTALALRYVGNLESVQAPSKEEIAALSEELEGATPNCERFRSADAVRSELFCTVVLAEAHRLCLLIKQRAEELEKAKDCATELFKVEQKLQPLSIDTTRWLSCCNKDMDDPAQGPAPPMCVADAMNQELKAFQDLFLTAKTKKQKLESRLLRLRCDDIESAVGASLGAFQSARDRGEESISQAENRLKKEVEELSIGILEVQTKQIDSKDQAARVALKAEAAKLELDKNAKVVEWKAKRDEVEKEWERVTKANASKPFSFLRGRAHMHRSNPATTPTTTPKFAKKEAVSSSKPGLMSTPAAGPSQGETTPKKKGSSFLRGPTPK